MNYLFICFQVDRYTDLVKEARSLKERVIRKQSLMYYQQLLNEYSN